MARPRDIDRRLQKFWEDAAETVSAQAPPGAEVTAAMLAAACKRLSDELGDDGAAECLAKLAVAYQRSRLSKQWARATQRAQPAEEAGQAPRRQRSSTA